MRRVSELRARRRQVQLNYRRQMPQLQSTAMIGSLYRTLVNPNDFSSSVDEFKHYCDI
jgi:hypothetical protein